MFLTVSCMVASDNFY